METDVKVKLNTESLKKTSNMIKEYNFDSDNIVDYNKDTNEFVKKLHIVRKPNVNS